MTTPGDPLPERGIRLDRDWRLLLVLLGVAAYLAWRAASAFADPPLDPAARPLLGTWSTTTDGGSTLTWTFAADGTMHWDLDSDDFRAHQPAGMDGRYRLDRTVTPNLLDVALSSREVYLAIVEFTVDGTLRVDCNMPGSICRPDRPTEFTDETWTMRRKTEARR